MKYFFTLVFCISLLSCSTTNSESVPPDDGFSQIEGSECSLCPAGKEGPKGEKGDTGIQGPQGEKGDTGIQGPQGAKGDIGPTGVCACDDYPNLHWLLRDKNGDAVDVRVNPYMPGNATNSIDLPDIQDGSLNYDCFGISHDNGHYFYYSLKTGTLNSECYNPVEGLTGIYFDSECSGQEYAPRIYSNFLFMVDNLFYTIWGAVDEITPNVYYRMTSGDECKETPNTSEYSYWKLRTVPENIVNRFSDGAPYTIAREY